MVAWLARIRSSLLLKTASSFPRRGGSPRTKSSFAVQRIAATAPLGNVAVW